MIFNLLLILSNYILLYALNEIILGRNFLLNNIPLGEKKAGASRIISSIHSIICFIMCYSMVNNYISNDWWEVTRIFSLGYCLHDTINIYINPSTNNSGIILYIHHLLMFCSLLLFNYPPYDALLIKLLFVEITNPFLNYSWFMHIQNKTTSIKAMISNFLLLLLFFYYRVVFLTKILLNNTNNRAFIPLLVLTPMNYYWFSKLLKMGLKKYIKLKPTKQV